MMQRQSSRSSLESRSTRTISKQESVSLKSRRSVSPKKSSLSESHYDKRTRKINLLRTILTSMNVLLLAGGLLLFLFGFMTVLSNVVSNYLIDDCLITAASVIAIILGLVIVASAILGIYASLRKQYTLLHAYTIALALMIFILTSAIVPYIIFHDRPWMNLEEDMITSMNNYGNGSDVKWHWDETQRKLKCCGTDSYHDWINLHFLVPESCCISNYDAGSDNIFKGNLSAQNDEKPKIVNVTAKVSKEPTDISIKPTHTSGEFIELLGADTKVSEEDNESSNVTSDITNSTTTNLETKIISSENSVEEKELTHDPGTEPPFTERMYLGSSYEETVEVVENSQATITVEEAKGTEKPEVESEGPSSEGALSEVDESTQTQSNVAKDEIAETETSREPGRKKRDSPASKLKSYEEDRNYLKKLLIEAQRVYERKQSVHAREQHLCGPTPTELSVYLDGCFNIIVKDARRNATAVTWIGTIVILIMLLSVVIASDMKSDLGERTNYFTSWRAKPKNFF